MKANLRAWASSERSKNSIATRPSTEPTAKPWPSGKQHTVRVWRAGGGEKGKGRG